MIRRTNTAERQSLRWDCEWARAARAALVDGVGLSGNRQCSTPRGSAVPSHRVGDASATGASGGRRNCYKPGIAGCVPSASGRSDDIDSSSSAAGCERLAGCRERVIARRTWRDCKREGVGVLNFAGVCAERRQSRRTSHHQVTGCRATRIRQHQARRRIARRR